MSNPLFTHNTATANITIADTANITFDVINHHYINCTDEKNTDRVIHLIKYAMIKLEKSSIILHYNDHQGCKLAENAYHHMYEWMQVKRFFGAGLAIYYIDPIEQERVYILGYIPKIKKLAFPGGKREWYENNFECAERETREEYEPLQNAEIKINHSEEIWPNSYTAEIKYEDAMKLDPNSIFTKIFEVSHDIVKSLYDGNKYMGYEIRK